MVVLAHQQPLITQGRLVSAGGPLIGQEYFRIYDQTGRLWFWWVSIDLAVDWRHVPEHLFDQEVRLYIIPWWLKLGDADGDVWYVYPEVDGSPRVEVSAPATGEGVTGAPALRPKNSRSRYRFAIVGGDLDVSAA